MASDEINTKYKYYAEEVTNNLRLVAASLESFDRATEWADLIKFLQRVSKVLSKYEALSIIPHKLILGKRLAQCLNPALPSGVHLKCLEVYETIFQKLGSALVLDLPIYSMGIFPIFQFAATTVKPRVLELLENYYLPLGSDIIPALPGMLMSVLPGLEDETNEMFPRVLQLLDHTRTVCGGAIFFRSLWGATMTSDQCKIPALNYLIRTAPKGQMMPGRDVLTVRSIESCLRDNNIMVQRSILDLVQIICPLNAKIFPEEVTVRLLANALRVLNRRDMSLNRRLFLWLLGREERDEEVYFSQYTKEPMVKAIRGMFMQIEEEAEGLVVCNIVSTLLDKRHLGSVIIDDILGDLMGLLGNKSLLSIKILKSVGLLLDQLELPTLWSFILTHLSSIPHPSSGVSLTPHSFSTIQGSLLWLDSILDILSLGDVQVQGNYLPSLLGILLRIITDNTSLPVTTLDLLQLCIKLVERIDVDIEQSIHAMDMKGERLFTELQCVQLYDSFFISLVDQSMKDFTPTFDSIHHNLLLSSAPLSGYPPSTSSVCQAQVSIIGIKAFLSLLVPEDKGRMKPSVGSHKKMSQYIYREGTVLDGCMARMWKLLAPEHTEVHSDVAESFMEMYERMGEEKISQILAESTHPNRSIDQRIDAYSRFGLLWRLTDSIVEMSRNEEEKEEEGKEKEGQKGRREKRKILSETLFLMMESLTDRQPHVQLVGISWACQSIAYFNRILDPFLTVLLDPLSQRSNGVYQHSYDFRRVLHVMDSMKTVIQVWVDHYPDIESVLDTTLDRDILTLEKMQDLGSEERIVPSITYLDCIFHTTLRYVEGKVPGTASGEYIEWNDRVRSSAIHFLRFILLEVSDIQRGGETCRVIEKTLVDCLNESVAEKNIIVQMSTLECIKVLFNIDNEYHNGRGKESQSPWLIDTEEGENGTGRMMNALLQNMGTGLLDKTSAGMRFYWLEVMHASMECCIRMKQRGLQSIVTMMKSISTLIEQDYPHPSFIRNNAAVKDISMALGTLSMLLSSLDSLPNSAEPPRESSTGMNLYSPTEMNQTSWWLPSLLYKALSFQDNTGLSHDIPWVYQYIHRDLLSVISSLLSLWCDDGEKMNVEQKRSKRGIQMQIIDLIDPLIVKCAPIVINAILSIWLDTYSTPVYSTISHMKYPPLSMEQQSIKDLLNQLSSLTPEIFMPCMMNAMAHVQRMPNYASRSARKTTSTGGATDEHLRELSILHMVHMYITSCLSDAAKLEKGEEERRDDQGEVTIGMYNLFDAFVQARGTQGMDKNVKRDLQEVLHKLFERCCAIIQGQHPPDMKGPARSSLRALTMREIGSRMVALVENVYHDKTEWISVIIQMVIQAVQPYLDKNDRGEGHRESLVMLNQITHSDHSTVSDLFYSEGFFIMDDGTMHDIKSTINNWMVKDKSAFPELLNRLNRSTPLFMGKEEDMAIKCGSMKRLSFVLYAGVVDMYNPYVSSIQERITEFMKNNNHDLLCCQVILCFRVMILRFSPNNIRSIWPTMATEMIKTVSEMVRNKYRDPLVLSLYRFLDQLSVLPSEDFNLLNWMFVSESWPVERMTTSFNPYLESSLSNRSILNDYISNQISMSSQSEREQREFSREMLANGFTGND
ncbi:hypothetical protein PROFUN_00581 [Planoprotostelium fungivorum]|uniref:Uncharacterized protein n=1 Tax=Planoprotostelium fungivorum TaxID=1890364 RepID=A0A2P6N1D5_9EUKA|nr:hypothetical protein PROFUN_00581 [Planoprotostelium fungivorum]